MTKPTWQPPATQFPDPAGRRDNSKAERRFLICFIIGFTAIAVLIITTAIVSANTPNFYDRCTKAGGVVVGNDTCVRKDAIIPNP